MNTDINSTNAIHTRQDFIHFLHKLLADYQSNKKEWENQDLESFLEALSSCAESLHSFYKNTNQNIDANNASWKVFADLFMGARIYE